MSVTVPPSQHGELLHPLQVSGRAVDQATDGGPSGHRHAKVPGLQDAARGGAAGHPPGALQPRLQGHLPGHLARHSQ